MAITCLAFNPMGDILATGSADKSVKLWSLKKKKITEISTLKNRSNPICAVSFSLDNDYLVACSTDHRATIYSLKGAIKAHHSFGAHSDLISAARFLFS